MIIDQEKAKAIESQMIAHAKRSSVPIGLVEYEGRIVHLGTGTIVAARGTPYLITCDHIARSRLEGTLAFSLGAGAPTLGVINPIQTGDAVNDVAVARLESSWLDSFPVEPVFASQFAKCFVPFNEGLFFIYGYPGFRNDLDLKAHFDPRTGHWKSTPMSIIRDLDLLPGLYDPRVYFAIPFREDEFRTSGKYSRTPHGLSGSAVWDTGVTSAGEIEWSPSCARIVGIAIEWFNRSTIICIRVEFVRRFLLLCLRQEAAYFNWLQRGQPSGDDWMDWYWAESAIRKLE